MKPGYSFVPLMLVDGRKVFLPCAPGDDQKDVLYHAITAGCVQHNGEIFRVDSEATLQLPENKPR